MPLRSWVTNNKQLCDQIENDDKDYTVPSITSVLGLSWAVETDSLSLKLVKLPVPEDITKHMLLTVFDPLGLFSPVIIKVKILIQDAWRTDSSWNDSLSEEFHAS